MDKIFSAMREYAHLNNVPIILDDTVALLKSIIRIKKPKRILEIGTAIGYSAGIMLTCCDATITTIDINEDRSKLARQNLTDLKLIDRVNLIVDDAGEVLPLMTGTYDVIFLDGAKGQYKNYYPYLKSLLPSGGVLISDNVLYKGLVKGAVVLKKKRITLVDNLREFLDMLTNDTDYETEILSTGDGVTISVKK